MNLLNKVWFVYEVNEPDLNGEHYICLSPLYNDFLGFSKLIGIFLNKREAMTYAVNKSKSLKTFWEFKNRIVKGKQVSV